MAGETSLKKLLASMSPILLDDNYVFCTFQNARYGDHTDLQAIASMQENEGLTLVILQQKADEHSISYDSVFRCISLEVQSSLDAVGLTAAFAKKLADHGISANVIAGFYHDHLFVNTRDATNAMKALAELSA